MLRRDRADSAARVLFAVVQTSEQFNCVRKSGSKKQTAVRLARVLLRGSDARRQEISRLERNKDELYIAHLSRATATSCGSDDRPAEDGKPSPRLLIDL